MRIAFISYEYPPDSHTGGIASYTRQAAEGLAARSHSVEVFAFSPTREISVEEAGVTVHWVNNSIGSWPKRRMREYLRRRHRERNFDLVEAPEYHAQGSVTSGLQVPLVIKMHTPTIIMEQLANSKRGVRYTLNALKAQVRMWGGALIRGRMPGMCMPALLDFRERAWAHRAERLVALNQDMVDFCVKQWKYDPQLIDLIPLPFAARQDLLEIPIQTRSKTIAFIGRLEIRKGIKTVIEALPKLLEQYPDARIRFIGKSGLDLSGKPFGTLIQEKLTDKQKGAVEFAGHISNGDLPKNLKDVDIVIVPSIWENFPVACLEAMAAGRAIIGTRTGGLQDQLDGGRAGILIPPDSPTQLVATILELLENDTKRWGLGAAARARVLSEYAPDKILSAMEASYSVASRNFTAKMRGQCA